MGHARVTVTKPLALRDLPGLAEAIPSVSVWRSAAQEEHDGEAQEHNEGLRVVHEGQGNEHAAVYLLWLEPGAQLDAARLLASRPGWSDRAPVQLMPLAPGLRVWPGGQQAPVLEALRTQRDFAIENTSKVSLSVVCVRGDADGPSGGG